MTNLVEVKYAQTGKSSNTNELGMREMQAMVYAQRNRQYLLVKAPPASGKSRAMMFVALDKLANQGVKKVIVAVPQQNIGRSFKDTALKKYGFFEDWRVAPYWNLCLAAGSENSKKSIVREFLDHPTATKLVCTHATLLNALNGIDAAKLDNVFFGIDEFHHGSADENNRLGTFIRRLLNETSAHILAMTGSYFRGDAIPVMRPEDEAKFQPTINYNYYQQLNGYTWLKSLGLGYHFFNSLKDKGNYLSAIREVLDTTKKTLIHIPRPNSKTGAFMNKHDQVAEIIKFIGEIETQDYDNFIYNVRTPDGRLLKVGNLVEDNPAKRAVLQSYLQRMNSRDSLDLLIALGTAMEGFDWEWCEHCITVGIRSSLTEVVQIIGRCTRDCEGKTHAQFTNLIPCPDAAQDDVSMAVNDFLKAISISLLMEQVMAPKWNFKTKTDDDTQKKPKDTGEADHILEIKGLLPLNEKTKAIVENDLDTLTATMLSDSKIREAIIGENVAEVITEVYTPKIIRESYPDLSEEEVEAVKQRVILTIATPHEEEIVVDDSGNKLIKIADKMVNINDLDINLIAEINPFQHAYEVISKSLTTETLRTIQFAIEDKRSEKLTVEEATLLMFKYLPKWREENPGKLVPEITDGDPHARRIALAVERMKEYKRNLLKQGNV